MYYRDTPRRARRAVCLIVLVLAAFLASTLCLSADTPPWIEPRALNIVDIVGQVPDSVLKDNIVSYSESGGVAQFVSSERDGELLRITVKLYPRAWASGSGWTTSFTLLGQRPIYDHMGSSVPEMWLRLYDGSTDLTSKITWGVYVDPALSLPLAGASQPIRYQEYTTTNMTIEEHGLRLPANYGGEFGLNGDYTQLTAVYTMVQPTNSPQVTYLGSQEASYRSYIGDPNGVGELKPLMQQLRDRYGDRHGRITLNIPTGANYVMFTYPPSPFMVWDASHHNIQRPSAGTVRLSPDGAMLSQDLLHGGAFPLSIAWQDADQVHYDSYLSLLYSLDRITTPENVALAGTPYDPCFLRGDCPDWVLEDIHDATATVTIIYLRSEPLYSGLNARPLRMADDSWSPSRVGARGSRPVPLATATLPTVTGSRLYLPLILKHHKGWATPTPTITGERPVGFFDPTTGHMVGYWP